MKTLTLPELLSRWRSWPTSTSMHEPQPAKQEAEQSTAKQEWEDEGGAIKSPIAPGPKLPL